MAFEFERIGFGECLLCGSQSNLTGEHKIKATLLRGEFGKNHMLFIGKDASKVLQGPKSKLIHFTARLCQNCNSSKTQPYDRAFDTLHEKLTRQREAAGFLSESFLRQTFQSEIDRDHFRYFSKVLSCFLAESCQLRSNTLSGYSRGITNRNPIKLNVRDDEFYQVYMEEELGGRVAHGGLIFHFDPKKRWVQSISSTILAAGILYEFWIELLWLTKFELEYRFSDIVETARMNIPDEI